MKRNIINGIILISALALGSCSTSKLASNQLKDDDVYYSEAKAGDQPVYVASNNSQNNYNQNSYNNYNDDDYYYYDSYSSRINRFGYFSPFSYYDSYYDGFYSPYYGYSPYFGGAYGYGYGGFGYGLGFGLGYYGYNPYYYGGFGYGLGYSYFGGGYGYGNGGGYWGVYSANRSSGVARPYRAQMPNVPGSGASRTTGGRIGYNGNYPNAYMGRPQRTGTMVINSNGQTIRTTSYGRNGNDGNYSRPQRPQEVRPQQQQVERSYSPPPSSSGGGDGGGRSSGGGGGGGGRPVRP